MTRREALTAAGGTAVSTAVAQSQETYPADLVRRHDESVDRLLATQITDTGHPGRGGYADEFGLYHAGAGGAVLDACMAAYLCRQSRHQGRNELVDRMRLAVGYLERAQLPSGNIDLLTTNFNSPPDTAFVTLGVASAARLAQLYGARELLGLAENWLRRAGAGMAVGGVHTPNHRWVVCEALASIDEVFPDPRYRRRIDQWLAEGIDIDDEGQFTERSTAIYNTVVDRALTVVAIKQKRWELLDYVRRNLDAMQYLLHANGEVVTEISRRQDRNERGDLGRYWLPLRYLAVRDGNRQYAGMARIFEARAASLPASMQYPELRAPLPAPASPPDDFEKSFPGLQVVRWRRGAASATLSLASGPRIFTVRKGEAVVQAVRFASAFFGKGQFSAQRSARMESGYRLEQSLEGPYYQPLDPPRKVTAADYNRTVRERRQSEICRLTQSVELRERKGGFSLLVNSSGTNGVPLAVEISLRPGGQLEGCTPVRNQEGVWLLSAERATYRVGADELRFGPGIVPAPHVWTQIRGGEPRIPGNTVYVTGVTPFRHTLEFDTA